MVLLIQMFQNGMVCEPFNTLKEALNWKLSQKLLGQLQGNVFFLR